MRDKNPLVSIVILNWNGNEDTVKCVESINKLTYKHIEVIVIDNGSNKPITENDITSTFVLKVVRNKKNLGFAGGEISALPYCNGKYIFLLNNDALIEKHAIANAVKVLEKDDTVAAVGGKSYLLFDDGNTSLGFYSYQYIDPITADVKTYSKDEGIQDVVTVSGSSVMIRRSVIDQYDYFDKRFFAYYEETDLFARYQRAGFRVVYDPSIVIFHKDGASTKDKRFMYYYLMLKNQFLFAYKNFDKESKKDFLKTYFRNFRRSVWVLIKDRSKTEGIHKARVRSTIWNLLHIVGTISSRRKNLAINPKFNYSQRLYTQQPIGISLILDATGNIKATTLTKELSRLLTLKVRPSEIIVVTDKAVKLPNHSPFINVKNIIDKKISDVTAMDLGFITSNNNILLATNLQQLSSSSSRQLSRNLKEIYQAIIRDEAAIAVRNFHGLDLKITNGNSATLVAIRKSDLVDFLFMSKNIYSIGEETLGRFINWIAVECKPIARLKNTGRLFSQVIKTPPANEYPILSSQLKWSIKKSLRALHLARIISKLRSLAKRSAPVANETYENTDITPEKFSRKDILNTPIFLNTRDLYIPLSQLISWLEKNGHKKIIFVDNDSTYPELLELFSNTKYQVLQLDRNGMHRSPWESFAVRFFAKDKPYVVSDPDIAPTKENPKEMISYLYEVLNRFPAYNKAGVSLKIDDIPDYYSMKQHVLEWESRYWDPSLLIDKDIYAADVDTTFALYRGRTEWFLSPSVRVGGIYAMHHDPWYQDLNNPTEDMMYYRARASNEVSTWVKGKLPKHHLRALKKEGFLKNEKR